MFSYVLLLNSIILFTVLWKLGNEFYIATILILLEMLYAIILLLLAILGNYSNTINHC